MKSSAVHLTFDGNCKEAFDFCAAVFQNKLSTSMTMGESPMKDSVPENLKSLIMHTRLEIGLGDTFCLIGGDRNPMFHKEAFNVGNHSQICLTPDSPEETERIFRELGEGGKVTMPLAKQFWGSLHGALTDKFGIRWMFDLEQEEENKELAGDTSEKRKLEEKNEGNGEAKKARN